MEQLSDRLKPATVLTVLNLLIRCQTRYILIPTNISTNTYIGFGINPLLLSCGAVLCTRCLHTTVIMKMSPSLKYYYIRTFTIDLIPLTMTRFISDHELLSDKTTVL